MIAVVFPGQGSQAPGMGRELFESSRSAKAVFEEVADATKCDVAKLCFETDADTLRKTENAQLALYTVGLAVQRVLADSLGTQTISVTAGHSVGEYAALAAAEVFSVKEGARLVRKRGQLMAESGLAMPGTMAAVLGLDRAEVEACCSAECVVANDNCPGQLVISGTVEGVKVCSEKLLEKGAKRVMPLNVSGAFHSPLMVGASQLMAEELKNAEFRQGKFKVYSNVTARVESDWAPLLQSQLKSPVRWTESVQNMSADGVKTYIECGHGKVLSGLIKRISPDASILSVSDPASLEETLLALKGATV